MPTIEIPRNSKLGAAVVVGWVLTVLVSLFLVFDGVVKIVQPASMMKASAPFGYSAGELLWIGVALLVGTVLYILPKTMVLGAIILTGYLGGAIDAQLRIHAGLVSLTFPFLFCVFVWLAVYLREPRVRAIVPSRN